MARRRRIGGNDGELDINTLLALKQQQSPGMDPMGMAMKMLGLQQQGEQEARSEERESRAQQSLQKYYEGLIGEQKAQTAAQRSAAETAAAERKAAEEFRTGTTTRDIQARMDAAAEAARAAKAKEEFDTRTQKINALDKMIERGVIKPEQGQAMLQKIDPSYAETEKELKEQAYAAQLEKYKGMTAKERAAIAKAPAGIGGPEIYKRILAETQAAPGGSAVVQGDGGDRGLASMMWNVPGAFQNVGKGIANLLLQAGGGAGAPQVPYTEYTDPYAEIPRYKEAQAILNRTTPVGPAPEESPMPVLGNYGPYLPASTAAPEWQYGVGRMR